MSIQEILTAWPIYSDADLHSRWVNGGLVNWENARRLGKVGIVQGGRHGSNKASQETQRGMGCNAKWVSPLHFELVRWCSPLIE